MSTKDCEIIGTFATQSSIALTLNFWEPSQLSFRSIYGNLQITGGGGSLLVFIKCSSGTKCGRKDVPMGFLVFFGFSGFKYWRTVGSGVLFCSYVSLFRFSLAFSIAFAFSRGGCTRALVLKLLISVKLFVGKANLFNG